MTKSTKQERPKSRRHSPRLPFFVLAGLVAVVAGLSAYLEVAYAGKISPRVAFAGQQLGGRPLAEAEATVRETLTAAEGDGVPLHFGDKVLVFEYTVADPSGLGLSTDVVLYDEDATVKAVTGYGSSGSPIINAIERIRALAFGINVMPRVSLDQAGLRRGVQDLVAGYEDPAVEPGFTLGAKNAIAVSDPKPGKRFDVAAIAKVVEARARAASTAPIEISLKDETPSVTAAEAETLVSDVEGHVAAGNLTMTGGAKDIAVKPATFITWFEPQRKGSKVELAINEEVVTSYLKGLLPEVSTVAKNAKFSFKDGVVTQIQGSSVGRELDIDESVDDVVNAVSKRQASVKLTLRDVTPEATAETIGNLGIKELVAVGRTNFAGSPVNRRFNLKVGSDLLNGRLIRPGEEFSLVKAIGPVDATLGYRQELVIKGDRTIPEFGGGLCQVATTLFRAVMNSGLPVIERRNHSYRVSYYEPPVGMDATIYEPKPDFRFKNDYGTYLLLQTRVEGDELIFEFWGTKDGRVVKTTTPRVYNTVKPPAPLTIETTDIPVGTTKCIERAHPGSDAEFTYSVTDKNGKTVDTLFQSHYRPWRQVCLVGVKEVSKPDETQSD